MIIVLGLRYDDLYDPMQDLDIKCALDRLPREVVNARNQRLKRAIDLSMKHEYLSEEMQVFFCLNNRNWFWTFGRFVRDFLYCLILYFLLILKKKFMVIQNA